MDFSECDPRRTGCTSPFTHRKIHSYQIKLRLDRFFNAPIKLVWATFTDDKISCDGGNDERQKLFTMTVLFEEMQG